MKWFDVLRAFFTVTFFCCASFLFVAQADSGSSGSSKSELSVADWNIEDIVPNIKAERGRDPQKMVDLGLTCLSHFKGRLSATKINEINMLVGEGYARMGKLDQSELYFQNVLDLAKNAGDTFYVGNALFSLGNICNFRGQFEKAIEYYLAALEIKKQVGGPKDEAALYNNIASIHSRMGQHETALRYFKLSIETYLPTGHDAHMVYNNMGRLYLELEEWVSARDYFEKSLDIVEASSEIGDIAKPHILNNLATLHAEVFGSPEKGYEIAMESLRICREVGPKPILPETHGVLAKICLQLRKKEEALEHGSLAVQFARENEDRVALYNAHQVLYLALQANGQYRQALQEYVAFRDLQAEVLDDKTKADIARLQMQYDMSEKEREVSLLKKENQIQTLKAEQAERSKFLFATGVLFVLVLTLLLVSRYNHQRNIRRERMLNRELKNLDRLKDEFLANSSHELRTPLHGITGILESILDGACGKISRDLRRNLSLALNSSERLLTLVEDLLDFSKAHQGIPLQRQSVDLKALVDVVLGVAKPLASDRPIQLQNQVPDHLACVDADEDRLFQILLNLVSNAVKFTPRGKVFVGAQELDGQVEIFVSDTGIGINDKDLRRIFNPFEQVDGSAQRTQGGTGLGLAIADQLVRAHQSTLSVQSTEGQGSVFCFLLPRGQKSEAVAAGLPMRIRKRPTPQMPLENLEDLPYEKMAGNLEHLPEQPKILVIDDDPVNLKVMENFLRLRHAVVRTAQSAKQAYKIIQNEGDIEVVVLDLMMPEVSGFEVCLKIRETFKLGELPIVILTARAQSDDLVSAFEAGANDYLVKPVDKNELYVRLKTHIQWVRANRRAAMAAVETEKTVAEVTGHLSRENALKTSWLNALGAIQEMSDQRVFEASLASWLNAAMPAAQLVGLYRREAQSLEPVAIEGPAAQKFKPQVLSLDAMQPLLDAAVFEVAEGRFHFMLDICKGAFPQVPIISPGQFILIWHLRREGATQYLVMLHFPKLEKEELERCTQCENYLYPAMAQAINRMEPEATTVLQKA